MPLSRKPSEIEKPDGVTYTQSFAAVIRAGAGGKKLLVRSQRWYHNQLQKFKDGEQVTLVVHNRRPKRSEAQNRYLWGVFYPLIAEETGEQDLERLHELFKSKFLAKGIVEVLGEKVRLKKSSTELSVSEFCEFIIAIQGHTGVVAPPTENYGLDSLQDSINSVQSKYAERPKEIIEDFLPQAPRENTFAREKVRQEKSRVDKKKSEG